MKIIVQIFLTSALLSLIAPTVWGQNSLYALSSTNDIYRIDPQNCTSDLVISGSQLNTTASFTDIAYEQGVLYAISTSLLYEINLTTGQVNWINLGNGIDPIANGLTGNQNGFLYAAGHEFSRINLGNGLLETIGVLGFYTQGDIEIINDDYYISAEDSTSSPILIHVTETPYTVTIIDSIPNRVYGISHHSSLANNELYASLDSTLIIIDVNNANSTIVCPNVFENYTVFGLTSATNNLSNSQLSQNPTQIYLDLKVEMIHIECANYNHEFCYVRNHMGQIITQTRIADQMTSIDISEYPKGIYFVTVNFRDKIRTQKILIY